MPVSMMPIVTFFPVVELQLADALLWIMTSAAVRLCHGAETAVAILLVRQ